MNPRLIGDEMVDWSDLDGTHGPGPVRGAALRRLAGTATGRTLIAGPHDPELIDTVPADDLTLLVRGIPDAEALAARYADRPGVTVCCGSLEKLAEAPAYDTVIALDGLWRLSSVEGAELSWQRAAELLRAALRPDGRLLLAVENVLGLHRLVALAPEPTDSDWMPVGEYDPTRPAGLPRLLARLEAAGLTVARAYSAFPAPLAPSALLGAEILADAHLSGVVAATLSRACVPTAELLADPRRLALTAVRQGAAATLAPAWVVLAQRGTAEPAGAPEAVLADGEIRRDEHGRWLRYQDGAGHRLPAGDTLEYLVIAACLRRDMPAVRELLRGWQSGPAAEVPADQVVVGPDGDHTALVPAGPAGAALRGLADTLMAGGFPHPWPTPADENDLALTLATMAGRDLTPVAPAVPAGRRPDAQAFRELAATRDRLARQLAEARAKAEWYEETLAGRDNELGQARHTIEDLTAHGPARLGRALMGGARAARHSVRGLARWLNRQR